MEGQSLRNLEDQANAANQMFIDSIAATESAQENTVAAQKAMDEASIAFYNNSDYTNVEERRKEYEEAKQAVEDAKAAEEAANTACEEAAEAAQAAVDEATRKTQELRESRATDTSYVVHMARIECSYGLRYSMLGLNQIHGVYTRQIPQMTAGDVQPVLNVINFGGCKSKENPTLWAAAEQAAETARKNIKENSTCFDNVLNFFTKADDIQVTDSLLDQCIGECIMEFPAGTKWLKGHEKVTINGESPILRRCEMICKYGGQITILLSGQPE